MKEIPLTQGKVALVDDDMYDYLNHWNWQVSSNGYAARGTRTDGERRNVRMHREVMQAPVGLEVDHINGNKLDNQRANLRLCTHAQNGQNHPGHKRNTTGYKGVIWREDRQRYHARVMISGHQHHIGSYEVAEEAARAYDAKARELFGEFARTNFELRSDQE